MEQLQGASVIEDGDVTDGKMMENCGKIMEMVG